MPVAMTEQQAGTRGAHQRCAARIVGESVPNDMTVLTATAETDHFDLGSWIRKAAHDTASPPIMSWPTVEIQNEHQTLWWRMLPAFLRRPRQAAPEGPDDRRMLA